MPVTRSSATPSRKATSSDGRTKSSNSRVDQPNPWQASRPRLNEKTAQAHDRQMAQYPTTDDHFSSFSLYGSPASSNEKPKKANSRKAAKRQPGTIVFPTTVLPAATAKTDGRKSSSRALLHIGSENPASVGFRMFSAKTYTPKDPLDTKSRSKNGPRTRTRTVVARQVPNDGPAATTPTAGGIDPPSMRSPFQGFESSSPYMPSMSSTPSASSECSSRSTSATPSAIDGSFSSPTDAFQGHPPSVYSNGFQSYATHSGPHLASFSRFDPPDFQQYGNGLDYAAFETGGLLSPYGLEGEKESSHLDASFNYPRANEYFPSENWSEGSLQEEGQGILAMQRPSVPSAESYIYDHSYMNPSLEFR